MNPNSHQSIQKVAEEIEKNKSDILMLFEKRLKEQVEVPEDFNCQNAIAVIPRQIDSLIQTLIKCSFSQKSINSLAQDHAKLRAGNRSFTLEILISEFIILKDVIFEILGEKGQIEVQASNIIWKFIVYSIRVAVSEFENQRQKEAEHMSQDLNESDTLNKKISAQIITSNENEQRYRTLVQGVEDYAVFTLDPSGVITSWNPGAERMKGYTYGEAIGNHFSMLYPEEAQKKDEPMNHLHVALIEGRYRGEGLRQRKNGEIFLADVYIRPIYQDGKHLGFAKVVADVTERDKLIQAADISHTQLVKLKAEKEQREKFVMNLSHDLRGPLSVARASVELIGKNMDPNDKKRRFVDKSIVSIDRINKMIGDLLDANRIVGGEKPHLKLHEWDLVRFTRNVCDDYQTLGKRIELHSDQEKITGVWDGDALRRILENLISNAVKYGDNSYPVNVTIFDLDDMVCVKVHNIGEVIKETDQESLFDQFRRTESSERTTQGWGIGLSLVKGLTEAHGGSVLVESYPIEGTTFSVHLPKRAKENP